MRGPKCEKVRKSWVDSEIHTFFFFFFFFFFVLLLNSTIFLIFCVLRNVLFHNASDQPCFRCFSFLILHSHSVHAVLPTATRSGLSHTE